MIYYYYWRRNVMFLTIQKDYDSAYNDLLSAASTMTYTLVQNVLHADKP